MSNRLRGCTLLLLAALAGCEDGRVDVTLSADRPATTTQPELNPQQVVITVEALTLQRADNTEDRIELTDPVSIDLLDYDLSSFPLLAGEALDSGDYTGIRLQLSEDENDDNDNYIVDVQGGRRPLIIFDSDGFEPLAFSVKKSGGKTYTLQLRVDLRLSLAATGESRTFKPALRAARSTRAASVSGSVADSLVRRASCQRNRAAGFGVAVYAFAGHDITPDDADGSVPDPLASAPVLNSGSNNWSYRIDTLPPGDYTLALTCDGDIEDALNNNDIEFVGDKREITLDDSDNEDLDF